MNKMSGRVLCAIVVSLVACGCGRTSERTAALDPASQSLLYVSPDATNVRRAAEYDGTVSFDVADPYPAGVTIGLLEDAMKAKGWEPTTVDPLTGTERNGTRVWSSTYERSGERLDQWTGVWRRSSGEWVSYFVRFRTREPDVQARVAHVIGILMKARTVERLRAAVAAGPPQN